MFTLLVEEAAGLGHSQSNQFVLVISTSMTSVPSSACSSPCEQPQRLQRGSSAYCFTAMLLLLMMLAFAVHCLVSIDGLMFIDILIGKIMLVASEKSKGVGKNIRFFGVASVVR